MRQHQELGYADGLRALNRMPPIAYPYQDKYSPIDEKQYLVGYNNALATGSATLQSYAEEQCK